MVRVELVEVDAFDKLNRPQPGEQQGRIAPLHQYAAICDYFRCATPDKCRFLAERLCPVSILSIGIVRVGRQLSIFACAAERIS
jgi:hypothetical protein